MEKRTIIIPLATPTWNDKFELPGGSYSVLDIQDYFDDILKKHKENINNLSMKIYADKIKNRTTFNVKNGYNLKLLTSETIKLLGSTENKITKDKSGKNILKLQISTKFKSLVHISSKQTVWQFIRNFSNKLYPFKNIQFRISGH